MLLGFELWWDSYSHDYHHSPDRDFKSWIKGRPSAGGSHMSGVWGREKPRQAFPPQICGEAASNPRPGDSVRQLSPLHQACPSLQIMDLRKYSHGSTAQ